MCKYILAFLHDWVPERTTYDTDPMAGEGDCQKQTAMYDLLQPCPAYHVVSLEQTVFS